jgi:hypothetical protein
MVALQEKTQVDHEAQAMLDLVKKLGDKSFKYGYILRQKKLDPDTLRVERLSIPGNVFLMFVDGSQTKSRYTNKKLVITQNLGTNHQEIAVAVPDPDSQITCLNNHIMDSELHLYIEENEDGVKSSCGGGLHFQVLLDNEPSSRLLKRKPEAIVVFSGFEAELSTGNIVGGIVTFKSS